MREKRKKKKTHFNWVDWTFRNWKKKVSTLRRKAVNWCEFGFGLCSPSGRRQAGEAPLLSEPASALRSKLSIMWEDKRWYTHTRTKCSSRWRMKASLPGGGFSINAPKGCCLKECRSRLWEKKKTEKEQEHNKALHAHPHTMCGGTMPLLTTFLQEIIHHTGTPAGYGPLLCGNPA